MVIPVQSPKNGALIMHKMLANKAHKNSKICTKAGHETLNYIYNQPLQNREHMEKPTQITTLKNLLLQGRRGLTLLREMSPTTTNSRRQAIILEENISTWERNLTALLAMHTTLHIKHVDTEQATGQPIISLEYSHSTAPDVIERWLTENPAYSLHTLIAGKDLMDCQYGFVAQVTRTKLISKLSPEDAISLFAKFPHLYPNPSSKPTTADDTTSNTLTVQEDTMTTESKIKTPNPTTKPKTKRVRNRKSKAAATPKVKVHTLLFDIISATSGVTRTAVLANTGLRAACLTPKGLAGVKAGDALETKRWGRKINRFLRQIRRDGHDIIVTRTKDAVTYAIAGTETEAAAPALEDTKTPDTSRDTEEADQLLSFESLMNDLDVQQASDVLNPNVPTSQVLGQSAEMKSKKLLF